MRKAKVTGFMGKAEPVGNTAVFHGGKVSQWETLLRSGFLSSGAYVTVAPFSSGEHSPHLI